MGLFNKLKKKEKDDWKNAYNEKEQLRFATISVQSPKEYDLKV